MAPACAARWPVRQLLSTVGQAGLTTVVRRPRPGGGGDLRGSRLPAALRRTAEQATARRTCKALQGQRDLPQALKEVLERIPQGRLPDGRDAHWRLGPRHPGTG
ncbi:hypothetical protein ACPA9J_09870 [Pseudomonas aeruginosa]